MSLYYYRPGHPKANDCGMVDARDLGDESSPQALHAPIMLDRFYENTVAIDGKTDIGSRRKYREYLKANGYTHESDYSPEYFAAERKRQAAESLRETRETVARVWYERHKP